MAAAGRERRAERLTERLRGAQRTVVADDESFNLNIDDFDQSTRRISSPASHASTISARKRKRNDEDPRPPASHSLQTTRATPQPRPNSVEPAAASTAKSRLASKAKSSSSNLAASSPARSIPAAPVVVDPDADELEAEPRRPFSERARLAEAVIEEVEESPVNAPGSGRRRIRNPSKDASTATKRLQAVVEQDGSSVPSSSPLVRKVRLSKTPATMPRSRSVGTTPRRSPSPGEDDLTLQPGPADATVVSTVDRSVSRSQGRVEEANYSAEEAEEVDVVQAARVLGRKRPRRSMRTSSPEPEPGSAEAAAAAAERSELLTEDELRVEQSLSRDSLASRSIKAASKTKPKPKAGPKSKPRKDSVPSKKQRKQKSTRDNSTAARRPKSAGNDNDGDDDDEVIEITVQRFVNNKKGATAPSGTTRATSDEDDLDPLQSEIPFANRTAETVVNVLAQVCDEIMANALAQFRHLVGEADDASKKECRIKMRAIEAYREELGSRLLQHAIHLDHWHTLRKQVRHAQKEKLALRNEILRLRAEREQVALRIDAVRIKHEVDSKESTRLIDMSTLMNDVEVAVELGRGAPELSRQARRQADLANLELSLARVVDEVSSASSTGGMLRQITEFNALLERAALALESR